MRSFADLRKAAGLSQRGLARRVGLTQARVARLERGAGSMPDERLAARLAGALGAKEHHVLNAASSARFARRGLREAVRAGDIDRVGRIARTADVPAPVRREATREYTNGLRRLAETIDRLGDEWIGQLTAAGVIAPTPKPEPERTAARRPSAAAEAELEALLAAAPDDAARARMTRKFDRQPWSRTVTQMLARRDARAAKARELMEGVGS